MSMADKLTTIAENQQKVYDAGYTAGQKAGGGGDSHYDTFWDAYQENGERSGYAYAFAGLGWTNTTCKPKYDMQPVGAERMFAGAYIDGDFDEELGVALDFSRCKNMAYAFYQFGNPNANYGAVNTTLGTIDLSSATDVTSVFNGVGIIGIKLLIPPTLELKVSCFQSGLSNLTVGGYFTKSVNLSRCTALTRASIESVVQWLSDDVTGQTATFSKTAVNAAFTADEWDALVATKPNWEVTCV